MAETILHPRPSFYTFLQADNPKGGDALTYYDYQRALRAKKVEILQQKRATSYEPGYMKPWVSANSSRKVFQLKNRFPGGSIAVKMDTVVSADSNIPPKEPANEQINKFCSNESVSSTESTTSLDGVEQSASKTSLSGRPLSATGSRPSSATAQQSAVKTGKAGMAEGAPTQVQTERLPRLSSKPRLIKSATARDASPSKSVTSLPLPQRPKTVATAHDLRDSQTQTAQAQQGDGFPLEGKPLVISTRHPRAHSEGSNHVQLEISAAESAELCKSFQWATTTQRSYDEVIWPERPPIPRAYLPTTTIEQFPDPVSQKLTFRRYNSEPAGWQTFGSEWDYVQTRRCDSYLKGPQAITFRDSSRKTQQIPGYSGYIPGLGIYEENLATNISPAVLVRTLQPRKTTISRRANIPGYAGHVHWTKMSPTHSNMPVPEPTTTARTHRAIPLEDEVSPFRRDGVMSKMITTVSPYNPFNKIQY